MNMYDIINKEHEVLLEKSVTDVQASLYTRI